MDYQLYSRFCFALSSMLGQMSINNAHELMGSIIKCFPELEGQENQMENLGTPAGLIQWLLENENQVEVWDHYCKWDKFILALIEFSKREQLHKLMPAEQLSQLEALQEQGLKQYLATLKVVAE